MSEVSVSQMTHRRQLLEALRSDKYIQVQGVLKCPVQSADGGHTMGYCVQGVMLLVAGLPVRINVATTQVEDETLEATYGCTYQDLHHLMLENDNGATFQKLAKWLERQWRMAA